MAQPERALVGATWVAERLGIHRKSVNKAAAEGRIPGAVKLSGAWQFDPDLIEPRQRPRDQGERFLSATEVAKRWGVSTTEVQRRAKKGKLRGVKSGVIWLFALTDVEAHEEAHISELLHEQDEHLDEWEPVRQALRQCIRAELRPLETLKPYCRRRGLPDQAIQALLTGRATLSRKNVARLRKEYGDRLPPMPGEESLAPTAVASGDDPWADLRQFLRDDRDPSSETVKAFARRRGLVGETMRGILNGSFDPSPKTLDILCKSYGARLRELLGERLEFLSPPDAADLLGITLTTLKKWSREGKVVPALVGKRSVRYRRSELVELREELTEAGWQPPQPRPPEARHRCSYADCTVVLVDQKPSRRDQRPYPRRFCSQRCENLHAVKSLAPTTQLGRSLRDRAIAAIERGESLPAFARRHGVTRTTMLALIKDRRKDRRGSRPPTNTTLARLRKAYDDDGDAFPENIVTESARRASHGRALLVAIRADLDALDDDAREAKFAEARKKRSDTMKRRRAEIKAREQEILARDESDHERIALLQKRRDAIAKRRQTQAADPSRVIAHQKTHAERMRSLTARVRMSLVQRLVALKRNRPDNPKPTPDERRQWERSFISRHRLAEDTGLSLAEIHECWKRAEVELGLRHRGGRKVDPAREAKACQGLRTLMTKHKWDGTGDAPHRFNVEFSDWIELSFAGAIRLRDRHLAVCPLHSRGRT